MQWDSSQYAGFSTVEPWLPIAPNYIERNVEMEKNKAHSFINLYKQLIKLRRENESLTLGEYYPENEVTSNCFLFHRKNASKHHLIALNFNQKEVSITLQGLKDSIIILSTYLDRKEIISNDTFILRADEGCLIEMAIS